jgi:protein involved in polysaccharide export with SLBB domain
MVGDVIRALSLSVAMAVAAATAYGQTPARAPATAIQDSGLAQSMLRPGDIVQLRVFREPDLSGDFRIDETGTVVLPHLGSISATSATPDSVRSLIVTTYSRYLRDPAITVTFLRRVSVLGEVKSPGVYNADPTQSVADVIALAGGITPDGRRDRISLIRNGHEVIAKLTPDEPLVTSPIRSGDQLYVPQKSWIARNPAAFAGILSGILGGAAAIIYATRP